MGRPFQAAAGWRLKTDRFDISATLPAGAPVAQVPAMLQSLLEDRFGLKFHKSDIAGTLTPFIGLPTVNGTDIEGFYDFSFNLVPEDYQSMMMRAASARGVAYPPELLAELQSMSPRSFIDGLDKVGLKLEKGKATLDVINIDELRKTPTEN